MKDKWRDSNSDEQLRSWDLRAHARTVITEEHRMIHDGFYFYRVHTEAGIPDGQVRNTLLRVGDKPVHFKGVSIDASEGPIVVTLYENSDVVTPGVVLQTFNANRLSSNESLMTLYDDTTVYTALGDPVLGGLYVPANGNQGVTGSSNLEELILKPNTDYTLEWENDPLGAGTADVHVVIAWYEIGYEN